MEPADQSHSLSGHIRRWRRSWRKHSHAGFARFCHFLAMDPPRKAFDFLPDADQIEQTPLPRMARITLYVALTMVALAIVWACVSQVDRVVTARGKLVTHLPNVVVQPIETAIVQSVSVRRGQVVRKGDILATLDSTFAAADLSQLKTQYESLRNQSERLAAEIQGAQSGKADTERLAAGSQDQQLQGKLAKERQDHWSAQRKRLTESIAKIQASMTTNRQDQSMLSARLSSLLEQERMQRELVAENFSSKAKLLESQDRRLEVERELTLTRNREQELKRDLAASQAELDVFERGWRQRTLEDLLSTTRDQHAVQEQLRKADKRNDLITLVAPVDAVVLDMAKVSPGTIIREAEALITLVPISERLEAEVEISSGDVGYVKVSDKVHVKLDAFPFQKHGTLSGKVTTLSGDAFQRDGSQGPSGNSYYAGRLQFDQYHLKNLPPQSRLLPGMAVSAEIVVGTRSVMSYLIWPLTRMLDESIREP